MAANSTIEWTDATWNVITGCTRVSRGCGGPGGGGCYAERLAATRLRHHPSRKGLTDRHGRWTGQVLFNGQWLDQPLRWKKPRRIFVCAHSDLFHENVPREWIDKVFQVMAMSPRHTFQLLTKRPARMRTYLTGGVRDRVLRSVNSWFELHGMSHRPWPLPNVWPGTSVEDQPTADARIVELLATPGTIHWISAEPLLGPVDLHGEAGLLDWVVAGGESGPNARPTDPDWVRSLRDQCVAAGIPFFFKQWGGITSKAGGCEIDGRTWQQMPEGAG